jgi:hypothetical protein
VEDVRGEEGAWLGEGEGLLVAAIPKRGAMRPVCVRRPKSDDSFDARTPSHFSLILARSRYTSGDDDCQLHSPVMTIALPDIDRHPAMT